MKNIRFFLSENVMFLEVKFSIYLNRRVFVMQPHKFWLLWVEYPQACNFLYQWDWRMLGRRIGARGLFVEG